MKSSKKLQEIISKIEHLAWTKVSSKTSNADFITTVYAINQYCNLADSLGTDRSDLRKHMDSLYPQFANRVYSKRDIQDAYDLIVCLYDFIYGRAINETDRGPRVWRLALAEMSLKAITAYRKSPKLQAYQYVNLLMYYGIQCKDQQLFEKLDTEVKELTKRQMQNLSPSMSDDELMNLIMLRRTVASGYFYSIKDYDDALTDAMEALVQRINVKALSDEQLLLWIRVAGVIDNWKYYFSTPTDQILPTAHKEMMRRSSLTNGIIALSWASNTELARIHKAECQRKLASDDRKFKDDFLREVLDIDINDKLSTTSLLALLSIYYSRYESVSFVLGGDTEDIRAFCKRRMAEIFARLVKRYSTIDDVFAKIKVLQAIQSVEGMVGPLGNTRDAKYFVYRNVETLLASKNELPAQAVQQLEVLANDDNIEFSCIENPDHNELVSLAEEKKIEAQYEMDILNASAICMCGDFNVEEVVGWINYLVAKSKRTNNSQIEQIRCLIGYVHKYILSADVEIYDKEADEKYCKVIRPITTQSLIALADADLYLLSADDEHINTDECVHTCDITHELSQRCTDTIAKDYLARYNTELNRLLLSNTGS